MMQYDVKASTLANTGSIGYATRLKGLVISYTAGTGSVVLKDGGSSGTIRFSFTAPATTNGAVNIIIPGEGIRFDTSIYGAITDATVTVFYG
ncbi:hypothetical protein EB001_17860 [bacterium]|jgi:hypothetical protein|nr:hypothetical protein [bacterium]